MKITISFFGMLLLRRHSFLKIDDEQVERRSEVCILLLNDLKGVDVVSVGGSRVKAFQVLFDAFQDIFSYNLFDGWEHTHTLSLISLNTGFLLWSLKGLLLTLAGNDLRLLGFTHEWRKQVYRNSRNFDEQFRRKTFKRIDFAPFERVDTRDNSIFVED